MARPRPNVKQPVSPSPAAPAPAPALQPAAQTEANTMNVAPTPSPAAPTPSPAAPTPSPVNVADPALADPSAAPAPAKPPRKPRSPSVSVAHLYKDAAIEEDIPVPVNIPAGSRGGRQGGYPFARLTKDGQSFFVPKSPDNPQPVKRLGSSVASMNKKCRPEGYQYICQPYTQRYEDGSTVEGARVWRVAYVAASAPAAAPAPQAA